MTTLRTQLLHVAHYLITKGGTRRSLDRSELAGDTINRATLELGQTLEQLRGRALLELADLAVGDAARREGAQFGDPAYRHPVRAKDGSRQLRLFGHLYVAGYVGAVDRRERHAGAEYASVRIHRPIADRCLAVCAERGLDPGETTLTQIAELAGDVRSMLDGLEEQTG